MAGRTGFTTFTNSELDEARKLLGMDPRGAAHGSQAPHGMATAGGGGHKGNSKKGMKNKGKQDKREQANEDDDSDSDSDDIDMEIARELGIDNIAANRELGRKKGFAAGYLRPDGERKPNGKTVKPSKPVRKTIRASELAALKAECAERLDLEDLDHGPLARVSIGIAKSKNHNMRRRLQLKKERLQREAERARIEKM